MSDGTFRLEVELGNEAMQTVEDVAQALEDRVMEALLRGEPEGRIRDTNGNTVGRWRVDEEA